MLSFLFFRQASCLSENRLSEWALIHGGIAADAVIVAVVAYHFLRRQTVDAVVFYRVAVGKVGIAGATAETVTGIGLAIIAVAVA